MYLHIVPIDQQIRNGQIYRGPMYLRWRFGTGYDWQWSLKDFGNDVPIALVITPKRMPVRDEDLRSYGIETKWIERAASPRERVHRTLGMALAMQAGIDRPDLWLGRDIHYGFGMLPAWDERMQAEEHEASLPRIGEWVLRGLFWVSDVTGRIIPLIAGAAPPVTDAFTAAADTALTTYSANWSLNNGNFQVLGASDDVKANASNTECGAFHNVETYSNAQYGQVKITAVSDSGTVGCSTRCAAAGTASYMHFYTGDSANYLAKMVTGTWNQLGTDGTGAAVNDLIKLVSNGTLHTPTINGSGTGTPGAQTDASLSSGKPGLAGWGTASTIRADDFEGGNVGSAAASLLLDRGRRFQDLLVR